MIFPHKRQQTSSSTEEVLNVHTDEEEYNTFVETWMTGSSISTVTYPQQTKNMLHAENPCQGEAWEG